ncbi:hypothetical protein F4778DRAFT_741404 [Xylariomycetidae sp. FL2044]|nr:hypothetical protein F4778DRAFT_741404 [Xylariomycetidae sp. FL2044]
MPAEDTHQNFHFWNRLPDDLQFMVWDSFWDSIPPLIHVFSVYKRSFDDKVITYAAYNPETRSLAVDLHAILAISPPLQSSSRFKRLPFPDPRVYRIVGDDTTRTIRPFPLRSFLADTNRDMLYLSLPRYQTRLMHQWIDDYSTDFQHVATTLDTLDGVDSRLLRWSCNPHGRHLTVLGEREGNRRLSFLGEKRDFLDTRSKTPAEIRSSIKYDEFGFVSPESILTKTYFHPVLHSQPVLKHLSTVLPDRYEDETLEWEARDIHVSASLKWCLAENVLAPGQLLGQCQEDEVVEVEDSESECVESDDEELEGGEYDNEISTDDEYEHWESTWLVSGIRKRGG